MNQVEKIEQITQHQKDPRLNMFVISCHVDKPLREEIQLSDYEVMIQAGAAMTDKRICEINDHDDCEDQISDRNQRYSELTAMYWIWKYVKTPYIGLEHYRRRFTLTDEQLCGLLDQGFDIITTSPFPLDGSVRESFCKSNYAADWKLFMDILQQYSPEYYELAKEIFEKDTFYPCNMNIFSREVYDEYCSWMFPILDAFYRRSPLKTDVYQRRDVGFIGERCSSLFVEKKIRDKARVIKAQFRDLKSESWEPEMECDLGDYHAVFDRCCDFFIKNQIAKCRNMVAGALRHDGINDPRIRQLAGVFRAALAEQRALSMTMFEYLPMEWRRDLNTVMSAYNGLENLVLVLSRDFSQANESVFLQFMKMTGFSDIVLLEVCKDKRLDSEAFLRKLTDSLIKVEDLR